MKTIAVVTGTRAEIGILNPLIDKIYNSKKLKLQLYVTGMHFLKEYGKSIEEIKYPEKEKNN